MPYFQANKTSEQILEKYFKLNNTKYVAIYNIFGLKTYIIYRRPPLFPYYDVRQGHQIL